MCFIESKDKFNSAAKRLDVKCIRIYSINVRPQQPLEMGDNDKPFICKHPDCYMTFSNEDHLNVHSKKHDMVLNLGLTKTNAIADQTPTPTRFIRNCEEVGLFQDLQNVNPFEETFRKAVENGSNGTLHVPETNSEDTLHTPQIFHTIEKKPEKYEEMPDDFSMNSVGQIQDGLLRLNSTDSTKTECISDDESPSKASYTSVIFSSKTEIDVCSSNSDDTVMTTDDGVSGSSQEFCVDTLCKPTVLREKLKKVIEKRKAEEDPLDIKETVVVGCRQSRMDLKSKFTFLPIKPKRQREDINIYDKNVSEVDKRRMMNRMAQMRSRERKKQWLDHMEEEMTRLRTENKTLVTENQKLKEENASLKTVLLKHNNCSLNIDLQKQALKSGGPKVKTIKTRPAILKAPSLKPSPQVVSKVQIGPPGTETLDISTPKTSQPIPKELPKLLPKPISSSVTTSVVNTSSVRHKTISQSPVTSHPSQFFPKGLTTVRPNTSPSSMYITLNVPQAVVLEIKASSNKTKKP